MNLVSHVSHSVLDEISGPMRRTHLSSAREGSTTRFKYGSARNFLSRFTEAGYHQRFPPSHGGFHLDRFDVRDG